jgi:hypothetical protein
MASGKGGQAFKVDRLMQPARAKFPKLDRNSRQHRMRFDQISRGEDSLTRQLGLVAGLFHALSEHMRGKASLMDSGTQREKLHLEYQFDHSVDASDDASADAIDLLDISEAAQFLNVSETSLRRWTIDGSLPCLLEVRS